MAKKINTKKEETINLGLKFIKTVIDRNIERGGKVEKNFSTPFIFQVTL